MKGDETGGHLVGIQAPKLPLGRRGFREWPLAREAKAALERIARGKRVMLSFGGRRRACALFCELEPSSACGHVIGRSAGPVEPNCHGSI